MERITFTLNGAPHVASGVSPNLTLLNYLRRNASLCGTKEGCAEGDCGACTVVIVDPDALGGPALRAVNSCLVLLPMVHGRSVFTVEGLADGADPHIVQEALVRHLGSQCGYCTPGVIMSMVEACHRSDLDESWKLDDQMCGNLCRCTGYRPIRDAAQEIAGRRPDDALAAAVKAQTAESRALTYEGEGARYFMPESVEALWKIRAAHPTAELVNGATDLGLRITKAFETIPTLISLEAIASLRTLELDDAGRLTIGAGVRLSDLEAFTATRAPAVERMLRFFGARQIKNRATVGGNLCTASPIGDLAPIFLALGADAHIAGPNGARVVPMADFFTGYRKTALRPDEILEAVVLPKTPAGDVRAVAYKVSKRQELDISTVSAGLYAHLGDDGRVQTARFAFGGMAATPARARAAEAAVIGQPWTEATATAAAAKLADDFSPIDDHRGSAWYRRTVGRNLLIGFFEETQTGGMPRLPYRPTGTVVVGPAEEEVRS